MQKKTMDKLRKKDQWRDELKALWNQFDPIGVLGEGSAWPDDEYESYIPQTFMRLERGESCDQLKDWIAFIVRDYMGLEMPDTYIVDFVHKLQEWHVRYKTS